MKSLAHDDKKNNQPMGCDVTFSWLENAYSRPQQVMLTRKVDQTDLIVGVR